MVRIIVGTLIEELNGLEQRIEALTQEIEVLAADDAACQRLMTVPGVGPVTDVRFVAAIDDLKKAAGKKKLTVDARHIDADFHSDAEAKMFGPLAEAMRIKDKLESYGTVDEVLEAFLASLPSRHVENGRWELVKTALIQGEMAWAEEMSTSEILPLATGERTNAASL